MLKRYGQSVNEGYSDERLTVNFVARQVSVNGKEIKLTALEFKLLAHLIDKFTGDGTLNVHIRRLREAIEINPNEPKYVVTVWGDGYKFTGAKA